MTRSWKRWGVVLDGHLVGGSVWASRPDVEKDKRDIGERARIVKLRCTEITAPPAPRGRKRRK